MIADINPLKESLAESRVRIDFTKVDGTERSMLCTRNFGEIPIEQHPKNTEKRQPNESVLKVFDIEKQEWRSIRGDSITSWNVQ